MPIYKVRFKVEVEGSINVCAQTPGEAVSYIRDCDHQELREGYVDEHDWRIPESRIYIDPEELPTESDVEADWSDCGENDAD